LRQTGRRICKNSLLALGYFVTPLVAGCCCGNTLSANGLTRGRERERKLAELEMYVQQDAKADALREKKLAELNQKVEAEHAKVPFVGH
jgi:hypothetical protein